MKRIGLIAALALGAFNLWAQDFNLVQRSHVALPGEESSNICGYAQDGREYALIGTSAGMRIYDVTDPDAPVSIDLIPGLNSSWREVKVWKHWAFVTTEAKGGLQIVDLAGLPASGVPFNTYKGDGAIAGQMSRIHALHVDTTAGFVHLYGCTMANNQAIGDVVLDIKTDPMNPTYVGQWNVNYIHDGYVNNDTLYGSHIYAGYFSVIDFKDKANPKLLATQHTPGNFTHNNWPCGDGKYLLTTDEVDASYLASYDISDYTNITEVDRFQTTPGSGSIVHNTHVRDGRWAVTSWYRDGVNIVDCSRPWNLVEVARYDLYPQGEGSGFNGTWGVYPFLPSGNLVCSNIEDGLYVLTPTFKEACWLEGVCTNANTAAPLGSVNVTLSVPNVAAKLSKNNGSYGTGYVDAGTYTATFSKIGYVSQTHSVNLVNGQVTTLNVALVPLQTFAVSGKAVEKGTGKPVSGAKIIFQDANGQTETVSNSSGDFNYSSLLGGAYQVLGGAWGYRHVSLNVSVPTAALTVEFEKGYQDDFFADLGWTTSQTATTGFFTRAEPVGTTNGSDQCNPEQDLPFDLGNLCYTSGNGGGNAATDDIDGGEVVLYSPTMDLTGYQNPAVSFHYWFYNGGGQGGAPNDHIEGWISNGFTEVKLFTHNTSGSNWNFSDTILVKNLIAPTDMMQVRFRSADDQPGHLVEAAIDGFWVGESSKVLGTGGNLEAIAAMAASPNPFSDETKIALSLPETARSASLLVFDLTGRLVERRSVGTAEKTVSVGKDWRKGVYFIQPEVDGRRGSPLKLIRI